jgi:hypothetical protein
MRSLLNNEERYVLEYLKSDRVRANRWGWFLAQFFAACVFAYGFLSDDRAMTFTGFGILFLFDIYYFIRQPRMTRTICSAVAKLEEQGSVVDQSRSQ